MSEVKSDYLPASEAKTFSLESPFDLMESSTDEEDNFQLGILNEFLGKIDGISIAKEKPKKGKFEIKKEEIDLIFHNKNDKRVELNGEQFTTQKIDSIKIFLADDFSYEDLPKLLLEIKNVSSNSAEIESMMTKISEKFKNEAVMLNLLLFQQDLQKGNFDNTNQAKFNDNIRKNLSIQAFTYFQLACAFDPNASEVFDFKNSKENTKRYETFLDELEKSKGKIEIPERSIKMSEKINETKNSISEKTGYFESEFLETFALDKNNFDFLDQDFVIDYLKKDIEDNPNFNFVDKHFLLKEIEKWQQVSSGNSAIKSLDDFNQHFSPLFFALDKVVSRHQLGGYRNISRGILQVSEKDFTNEIDVSLKKKLEDVALTNGIANVSKCSDFKDIFSGNFVQYFKERYKTEIDNIEKQKEKYKELKEKVKQNPEDKNSKAELANMQMDIARAFFAIFKSEEFIKFTSGSDKQAYTVKSLLHKEQQRYGANCMLLGVIFKTMWKEFFNEDLLAVSTDGHFFAALKDANNRLISLDLYEPEYFDITDKDGVQHSEDNIFGKNFYITGEFEEVYNAALWNWIGHESFNNGDFKKAELIYKKAIERMPNNPDFWRDLGDLYRKLSLVSRDQEQVIEYRKMSKKFYLRSFDLNPKGEFTNFQLGMLASDEGFEEDPFAVNYFKNVLKKNPSNVHAAINLAYVAKQIIEESKKNGTFKKLDVFIKDVFASINKVLPMAMKYPKIYKILGSLYGSVGNNNQKEAMFSMAEYTENLLASADKSQENTQIS